MDEPQSPSQAWRLIKPWILPGAIALVVGLGVHEGTGKPVHQAAGLDNGATVLEARDVILDRYVGNIDGAQLDRGAIDGMTKQLDPFSTFLPPKETPAFREETTGKFGGLGIIITLENGLVRVIAPLEETPAWRAGVLPGDLITLIDGDVYEFPTVYDAADSLKGEPGSTILLDLRRDGVAEAIRVEIERAIIEVRSVKGARMVEDGIGYVRLTSFQDDSINQLWKSLQELRGVPADGGAPERELRGLILDLRSNPGGLLDAAVSLCDLFIEEGVIVETRGRDAEKDTRVFKALSANTLLPDTPLAILVDGYSASASEITAGALADHGRAILVGSRTFGKASVQTIFELEEGRSVLKLTTARYYTPSGRAIHREEGAGPEEEWGLLPSIEAPVDPQQLRRIFRWQEDFEIRRLSAAANGGVPKLPLGACSALGAAGGVSAFGATPAPAGTVPLVEPNDPGVRAAVASLLERIEGGGGDAVGAGAPGGAGAGGAPATAGAGSGD